MVFLIGTNHELQHNGEPFRQNNVIVKRTRENFKSYIENFCYEHKINLIAEEMCEDVLNIKNTTSIIKEVSENVGIEHKFCDPNLTERPRLGIPSHGTEDLPNEEKRRYHNIREKFWLEKLNNYLQLKILFICGAEHIDSFKKLLESEKQKLEIITPYWGEIYYKI